MMIAVFASAWDNKPRWNEDVEWSRAVEMLTTHIPLAGEDKRQCPAWSPVRYKPGTTRGKRNVIDVHALVLDYDDGVSPTEALERWSGMRRLVHTSWSHSPTTPKCRLVLPLAEPISSDVWSGVYETVRAMDGSQADVKCKDPSRLFFVPAVGKGGPHYAMARDGDPLSLSDIAAIEADRLKVDHKKAVRRIAASHAKQRERVKSYYDARNEASERLRWDHSARREVAEMLGAEIVTHSDGTKARKMTCPRCSDSTVFFYIDTTSGTHARCDHFKTCQWHGPLEDLLK